MGCGARSTRSAGTQGTRPHYLKRDRAREGGAGAHIICAVDAGAPRQRPRSLPIAIAMADKTQPMHEERYNEKHDAPTYNEDGSDRQAAVASNIVENPLKVRGCAA
jgi:hypothetical protein